MIKNSLSSKIPAAKTDVPRSPLPEGDRLTNAVAAVRKETTDVVDITEHRSRNYDYSRIINSMYSYLLDNQFLTQREFDKAADDAKLQKESLESILINDLKIPKVEVLKSLSYYYQVPFEVYDEEISIPPELLEGIKIAFMRKNLWVPIRIKNDEITVAVDNPFDVQKLSLIKALYPGKSVSFAVSLKQDILKLIEPPTESEGENVEIDEIISQLQYEAEDDEDAESGIDEKDNAVIQLVNKIIVDAYNSNASDIHIEPYPGKKNTKVRFRVDGVCYLYKSVPYQYKRAITSRIKIMADIDIAERRRPQDGKIRFRRRGSENIELRISTVPTQGGLEDVVMRILATGEPIPIDKVGFSEDNYNNFLSCITKPYGLILVCGPTGSGKTTTLHSALGRINDVETKIWTAEDPIEITQDGLRQVQVAPKIGFDFAAALAAFLRSDPDVIMVGEMRDSTTAKIGIQASLTGHLVFSTLHTNSAAGSINRLLDMGLDPFNFADALLCILAQRLIRILCKDCKEQYHPSRKEYDRLVREYGAEAFARNVNVPFTDDLILYRPKGCPACNNSGYKGRMALHELLMATDRMSQLVQSKTRVEEIKEQALSDGMTTLKQDGIEKVFGGHCDLLQVNKVCIG